MPTATELLEQIHAALGDLPDRLAEAMAKKAVTRDEFGRFVGKSGTSTNPPGEGFLDSTQRLGHALGRFLPGFGEVASLIGNVREVSAAWEQWTKSLGTASTKLMPSSQLGPGIAPMMPAPVAPQIPTVPASLPGTTAVPGAFTQTSMGNLGTGWGQLTAAVRQMTEAVNENTSAQQQEAPDQEELTERLPGAGKEAEPKEMEASEFKGVSAKEWAKALAKAMMPKKTGPVRPKINVPSSTSAEAGGAEVAGSAEEAAALGAA